MPANTSQNKHTSNVGIDTTDHNMEKKEKNSTYYKTIDLDLEIPIIDLSWNEQKVVDAIMQAADDGGPGFFYLINHGIAPTILDATIQYARHFLSLPQELKDEIHERFSNVVGNIGTKDNVKLVHGGCKGYAACGEKGGYKKDEATDSRPSHEKPTMQMNLRETLTHRFPEMDELLKHGKTYGSKYPTFFAKNLWPKEEWFNIARSFSSTSKSKPSFRSDIELYFNSMRALASRMHHLFAKGLKTSVFPHDLGMCTFNIAHYPIGLNGVGITEHTDWEACTLLYNSYLNDDGSKVENLAEINKNPALEVYYKNRWVGVPHIPNAIIVNQGEMLSRWSGGRLKAPLHRVIANNVKHNRYTLISFWAPNYDVELPALGESGPILAGKHYMKREKML